MENRYQRNVNINILDDYWFLKKWYNILKIEPINLNNILINEYYIMNYVHYYF